MNENQEYNFVLICDNNYTVPTAVAINSIIKCWKEKNDILIFNIITVELSKENIDFIKKVKKKHTKFNFYKIDMCIYKDKISKIKKHTHVSFAALMKFELANILFDVNTVLYLDSDIIVINDLKPLFRINIDHYYLAASPELWKYVHEMRKIDKIYFNSGVLLFNLELSRKNNLSDLLWKEKIRLSNLENTKTMDQDTLNRVCGSKTLMLPIIYNCNPYFVDNKYLKLINILTKSNYKNIEAFREKIIIIHYVGKDDKPWIYSTARMIEYWDNNYTDLGLSIINLKRCEKKEKFFSKKEVICNIFRKYGVINAVAYILKKVCIQKWILFL